MAAKRRDGGIESWTIDYGGAPAYLSYLLDRQRYQLYAEEYGERTITHCLDGEIQSTCVDSTQPSAPDSGYGIRPWTRVLDPKLYELVLVLSDGAESFQSMSDGESPLPVLQHLMAIKSSQGSFLVRRCRRFLRRFCAQQGWQHTDDLGVAGIYLEDVQ